MKSKLLQLRKVLLVAAGLLVGASAWGEEFTNLKLIFNGTISDNLTYVLGEGEIADGNPQGKYWTPGVAVDTENQRLKFGNANLTAKLVSTDNIKEKDIVTIEFDLALGWSTKGTDRDFSFVLYNTGGGEIVKEVFNPRTASRFSSTIGFTANDVYLTGNANTDWSNKTHFKIVLNYATGEITGTTTSETATNKTATYTIQMNDAQKVAIGSIKLETGDMGTIDHANLLANLTVTTTVGDYSSTKTITYKYQTEEGTDITDIALAAGAIASATPDNGTEYTPVCLQEFTDSEFANDYKYVSGGEPFTVEEDREITLVYAKTAHPTTNVKVQYVYEEEVLKETSITENHPIGKPLTYWVNKYVLKDGTLYQTQQQTNYYQRTINVTTETLTETLTKTDLDNVVFFTEGEDIAGVSVGNTPTRASNGKEGHTGGSENYKEVTTLAIGKYKISINSHNGNNDPRHGNFKVGDNVVYTFEFASGTNVSGNSEEFEVLEPSTLYFACEGSSASGVDYLYVTNTAIFTEITSAGWATLYSDKALDFSETGLTAYTATYEKDRSVVVLNAVDKVPANTGVVLKGVKGETKTFAIPVITEYVERIEDNDLDGSATEPVYWNEVEGYDLYILAFSRNEVVEFMKLGNGGSSAAGKAYLKIPQTQETSGVRVFSVVFGDDTTGINEAIVNGEQKPAGTYNLNGQRVAQPTKGLYIVNGKKVIIK